VSINLDLTLGALTQGADDALLQYSQISALSQPENMNIDCLKTWLQDPDGCNFGISGRGEKNAWGDLCAPKEPAKPLIYQFVKMLWSLVRLKPTTNDPNLDLFAVRPPAKTDGLTRWVSTDFIPSWEECRKRFKTREADEENGHPPRPVPAESKRNKKKTKKKSKKEFKKNTLATYGEMNILRFTSAISTIVACLLPTMASVVLTQVKGTRNLLICFLEFAVLFAGGLIFLTSGTVSRVEVFTATAA
jgi:hypothetical protein